MFRDFGGSIETRRDRHLIAREPDDIVIRKDAHWKSSDLAVGHERVTHALRRHVGSLTGLPEMTC